MKSFHTQYVECRNNGTCYLSDVIDSFLNTKTLWCKRYNKQCSSKVCLSERVNIDE